MPLHEAARFHRATDDPPGHVVGRALAEYSAQLSAVPWTYVGYAPVPSAADVPPPAIHVHGRVDNAFRLAPRCGFEQQGAVVTTGFRTSRFAPILFWEVLHVLQPGGVWIDIDDALRGGGTPLSADDFPAREYFRKCLRPERRRQHGRFVVQTYRKTAPSPLAAHAGDTGWTFGILTAGPSPRAAEMARAILALELPAVEVIFCGPRPDGVPDDPRVRAIDLDQPEPRGWITRKKNLLAAAARHENLCLLHDRYVVTPDWATALGNLGPSYSVLTFPQAFAIDRDGQFTQRYADYQVLVKRDGLADAVATNVYPGSQIFYAPYDDFADTAFCCGGLYIARRTVWNLVQQDESLFHGEWEDVAFGLACQARGIPHRVNTSVVAESTTPHPMALTRIHDMVAPETPERGRLHVTEAQRAAARRTPERFKPIIARGREAYYGHVLGRLNQVAELDAPLTLAAVGQCRGLADFWRVIDAHVRRQAWPTRDGMAAMLHALSDTIFGWPNCELQAWLAANERHQRTVAALEGLTVVGWGTGSMFRAHHQAVCQALAFVVDRDPQRWGSCLDGLEVRPPDALLALDPDRTAVVVFSCFFDDIAETVAALGPYQVVPASAVLSPPPFHPLTDMVAHFEEVEQFYPTLFTTSEPKVAAA